MLRNFFSDQRNPACVGSAMWLEQGLQTTARGPNPAHEAISSGPQRHFASKEK